MPTESISRANHGVRANEDFVAAETQHRHNVATVSNTLNRRWTKGSVDWALLAQHCEDANSYMKSIGHKTHFCNFIGFSMPELLEMRDKCMARFAIDKVRA
jgi:hypothetical protein